MGGDHERDAGPRTSMGFTAYPLRRLPSHRTVWRWHFYAGLFCIPFVLWLSVTGSIYLFKPQIDAWLDRAYDNLAVSGVRSSAAQHIEAALAAVPGGVLSAYELPTAADSAVRILIADGRALIRVYVHPNTLQILGRVDEDDRFTRVIFRLHGELMLGDRGSMLVELAASWTVVMLITGLFLWWPRGAGVAGIVYPRLRGGRRIFWRDLHAVTGLWVSMFALFLLASGLPWAKSWGGMLKQVRQIGTTAVIQQDWSTGSTRERVAPMAPAASSEHGGHHGAAVTDNVASRTPDFEAIDRLLATVQALQLAAPVLISPPTKTAPDWTARSETQNRPQRVNLVLDARTGTVIERKDFGDRPLLDRIVGTGVAAHEGQLFGGFNQALGLFTTAGLSLVSVSAVVLWWRRRTSGTLGAPQPTVSSPLAIGVFVLMGVLGTLLPLLGLSMLGVLAIEKLVLRRIPSARRFLGLAEATPLIDRPSI